MIPIGGEGVCCAFPKPYATHLGVSMWKNCRSGPNMCDASHITNTGDPYIQGPLLISEHASNNYKKDLMLKKVEFSDISKTIDVRKRL